MAQRVRRRAAPAPGPPCTRGRRESPTAAGRRPWQPPRACYHALRQGTRAAELSASSIARCGCSSSSPPTAGPVPPPPPCSSSRRCAPPGWSASSRTGRGATSRSGCGRLAVVPRPSSPRSARSATSAPRSRGVRTLAAGFDVVHAHLPHDHLLARLALKGSRHARWCAASITRPPAARPLPPLAAPRHRRRRPRQLGDGAARARDSRRCAAPRRACCPWRSRRASAPAATRSATAGAPRDPAGRLRRRHRSASSTAAAATTSSCARWPAAPGVWG